MHIDDFQDIKYTKEENGICTAIISRPERRNAVSYVTFLELFTILEDMEQDTDAKVLILTGDPKGRAFTSGGYFEPNFFDKIHKDIRKEINLMDIAQKKTCMKFWNFKKPVLAAINGMAIGGGISMPLAGADLIYMADDAWFGFYFSKRAIIGEFGMNFLLPFYLGFQKAKEILYFGKKITAQEAYDLGLINQIVPNDSLMEFTRKHALELIPPNGPSISINLMKKTMHSYFKPILDKTLDLENKGLRKTFRSKDFRESMNALKEKRETRFIGK
ncbi:MAG: enoyl-CoA hydratase [Candidatus Lokiarchaeota archaeon]|nr:enoyl-CoA hydratase [Candidatus Lokiarchaeota archaeon]MBD3200869.1 enoyl-CoA hydratase [Candidatus Lokiarchaeota archaeon]